MDFEIKGNVRQGFKVVFTDGTVATNFITYMDAWEYARKITLEDLRRTDPQYYHSLYDENMEFRHGDNQDVLCA